MSSAEVASFIHISEVFDGKPVLAQAVGGKIHCVMVSSGHNLVGLPSLSYIEQIRATFARQENLERAIRPVNNRKADYGRVSRTRLFRFWFCKRACWRPGQKDEHKHKHK